MAWERNLWLPHFRTFCELVEGEENKLTTFSTWTILLGCNIIFQQHLCLGQLWRSNGRNSQVLGQAMKKRPTGHYKKYSHFKGKTLHLLPAAGRGAVSLIRQLRERESCAVAKIPGRRGGARAAHTHNFITWPYLYSVANPFTCNLTMHVSLSILLLHPPPFPPLAFSLTLILIVHHPHPITSSLSSLTSSPSSLPPSPSPGYRHITGETASRGPLCLPHSLHHQPRPPSLLWRDKTGSRGVQGVWIECCNVIIVWIMRTVTHANSLSSLAITQYIHLVYYCMRDLYIL